jgi:hypothetical protein
MPLFAEPKPPSMHPFAERPFWRTVLFVAAATTAIAAMRPWIEVQFVSLFGELSGPPGWQSSAGFTCLCTSALVAVMALAETKTLSAREAVRPASLLLAVVMTLSVLLLVRGPGMLRGVSATWTFSFYVGAAMSLTVLAACAVRFAVTVPSKSK